MEAAAPGFLRDYSEQQDYHYYEDPTPFQKNINCFVNLNFYCLLYARLQNMKKYIYTMTITTTTTTLDLAGGSSDMV